jgi:hypothetical protein
MLQEVYLVTWLHGQGPSWKPNNPSTDQVIPLILRRMVLHYRFRCVRKIAKSDCQLCRVRPSVRTYGPTGRILMTFDIRRFFEYLSKKIRFHLKSDKVKVKVIPQQAWVGPRGSGSVKPLDFRDLRHYKGGRSSAIRTGRLYPRRSPWYSFSGAESTPGYMVPSNPQLYHRQSIPGPSD